MSSLWTPSGEHRPEPPPGPSAPPGAPDEDTAARMAELREQILATPVEDLVANHVIGLWEIAALHLGAAQERGRDSVRAAGLVVDAVGALVEGLGDRLGGHSPALREALAQLRLAYVRMAGPTASPQSPAAPGDDEPASPSD